MSYEKLKEKDRDIDGKTISELDEKIDIEVEPLALVLNSDLISLVLFFLEKSKPRHIVFHELPFDKSLFVKIKVFKLFFLH